MRAPVMLCTLMIKTGQTPHLQHDNVAHTTTGSVSSSAHRNEKTVLFQTNPLLRWGNTIRLKPHRAGSHFVSRVALASPLPREIWGVTVAALIVAALIHSLRYHYATCAGSVMPMDGETPARRFS